MSFIVWQTPLQTTCSPIHPYFDSYKVYAGDASLLTTLWYRLLSIAVILKCKQPTTFSGPVIVCRDHGITILYESQNKLTVYYLKTEHS